MSPIQRIRLAQDFFRFAYLVGTPISFGLSVNIPNPPEISIWGSHALDQNDLKLDPDSFALCGTILQRLAYRLLAMELDAALSEGLKGEDRFSHKNDFVRNASTVIRLVRNTVAHNILEPVWKIDRKLQNRKFIIGGILEFDTTDLHGKPLKRFDFGGPIALFRLADQIADYIAKPPSSSLSA